MINPDLYSRLEAYFGEGNVRVKNEDVPMHSFYRDAGYRNAKGEMVTGKRLSVHEAGEEYAVSCPFCSDTRGRLTINHRWGAYDPVAKTDNTWLLNCYNEGCQAEYENRLKLKQILYGDNQNGHVIHKPAPQKPMTPREMKFPGPMWRLDDMKQRSPRHAAITYLEDRLMDPTYLGKRFGVSYCIQSNGLAHDRIIAPVYMHGELAGWQARSIGDPVGNAPKWFTSPGMKRGHVMYNFDVAKYYKVKVIVEGPPDVWGFGPQAMGVFGKSMAHNQRKLLQSWTRAEDLIVLMLDPTQHESEKGKVHHIEKLRQQLEQIPTFANRVLPIYLPGTYDPGEMERAYMWRLIAQEARHRGMVVPNGRHTKERKVRPVQQSNAAIELRRASE